MKKGKKRGKRHPVNALSAAAIRNLPPGRHADGNGLYLHVDPTGSKRWVLRTVIRGRRTELGLGGLSLVSLAEAREEAIRLRKIARKGGDPLAERRRERRIVPTFEEAARIYHESVSQSFRNPKHRAQWITTLETYAFPVFGARPVDAIASADVLAVLTPIWTAKPETARRVRQRMRAVFDWAKASGYRSGDNPVEGISKVLPKHPTVTEHHAALPYAQVPGFIMRLREAKAAMAVRLAFEFLILTAARTSEVLFARWSEIDLAAKRWIVPRERMKGKAEHHVPLSARCLEILAEAREIGGGEEYIFPGRRPGRPLSTMAFQMCLRRMGCTGVTPHGFRSSFRDWAAERTNTERDIVEAALAHKTQSKVEAAYRRTTLYEKRIPLMNAWAAYATAMPGAKVVRMGG